MITLEWVQHDHYIETVLPPWRDGLHRYRRSQEGRGSVSGEFWFGVFVGAEVASFLFAWALWKGGWIKSHIRESLRLGWERNNEANALRAELEETRKKLKRAEERCSSGRYSLPWSDN